MRGVEIQPFSAEHVDAAAGLLAQRHARHLEAEPLLSADVDFRAEVEGVWNGEAASGVVATRDGELVGYLLGVQRDATWGPNVWVELAGHAVEEPELIRDLYAVAAANWLEEGRHRHYAIVPATDRPLVDAWFRLSFGAQHAFGIQPTPTAPNDSAEGVKVRRATAEDVDAAIVLDRVLPEHQGRSPVFSSGPAAWTDEELREDFLNDLDDSEVGLFVAELEGRPVGLLAMVSSEKSSGHSGLARPERSALLGFAATFPEARGSGAGLALTAAGLDWARENGYPVVVTDWRETNLLSSRFWPARGFRRTFLRLYRSIP